MVSASVGLIKSGLKNIINKIWFGLYTRKSLEEPRKSKSSSGYEHVFMGELKYNKVGGFHNWLSFYDEEREFKLNYKGYMKILDLGFKVSLFVKKTFVKVKY